jgi:hypothetical protein
MSRGTDRMTAQDRILNMFRKTIQSSGSMGSDKPLSLDEQYSQINTTSTKRRSNVDDEIEARMNDVQLVNFRSTK